MSLDLGSSTWYQLVGNGRTEDQDQKKNQVTDPGIKIKKQVLQVIKP